MTCGLRASFRESGIINVMTLPLVAIRAPGLGFDAPIGIYDQETNTIHGLVGRASISTLIELANARFQENVERTRIFQTYVEEAFTPSTEAITHHRWEPKIERAERLREEGLKRRLMINNNKGDERPLDFEDQDDNVEPLGFFP